LRIIRILQANVTAETLIPLLTVLQEERAVMTRRAAGIGAAASVAVAAVGNPLAAATELPALELPPPRHQGGKPLNEALMLRGSIREYATRPLPLQLLSD